MDRARLIERLMATFLGELGDHTRAINEELLALEKSPGGPERGERFKSLFRSAHSLKGAARSVSAGLIEDVCHSVEGILASARADPGPLSPDRFALLFEAADAIEEAGARLRERKELSDSPLAAILPRLQLAAAAGPAPVLAPDRPVDRRRAGGAAEAVRSPGGVGFVKIPAEKLDTMLTRSGELLVARRRIESQAGELEALRDLVERWADEWRGLTGPTVELIRRIEGGARPCRAAPRPRPPRPCGLPGNGSWSSRTSSGRSPGSQPRTGGSSRGRPGGSTRRCGGPGCSPSPTLARGSIARHATSPGPAASRWNWSSRGGTSSSTGRSWRG